MERVGEAVLEQILDLADLLNDGEGSTETIVNSVLQVPAVRGSTR